MKSCVHFATTLALLVLCVSCQEEVTTTESVDENEAVTNRTADTRNHANNGPHFTSSCKCGQKLIVNRIIGGQETDVNAYPWQAALLDSATGQLLCGGSLINDRYVLTAAHCVVPTVVDTTHLRIRLREHSLSSSQDTQLIIRTAERIIVHTDYDAQTNLNDIALIKLTKQVRISPRLGPVCLPSQTTFMYAGRTAVVTGWGDTADGGQVSDVLMEVSVPVLSHNQCKYHTSYAPAKIFARMLCAGAAGLDSCQGDSGGPLVFEDRNDNYDQIGVVSWGNGCALNGYPGVYTRVNKYLGWIKQNTRDAIYCQGAQFP